LLMAASSSYPARSSDRARNAATQISTAFRTCPPTGKNFDSLIVGYYEGDVLIYVARACATVSSRLFE
jgi:hypothetical protein